MISSPSEYLFAVPSGIAVDGSPMPVRDRRRDGSWRILRGEDAAFLRECACRCAYLCGRASGTAWSYALFYEASTDTGCGRACGGGVTRDILSSPLSEAAAYMRAACLWFVSGFMYSPTVYDAGGVPGGGVLPPAVGNGLAASMLPGGTPFVWSLSAAEMRDWLNATQLFVHPTVRWATAAFPSDTGATGWHAQITPTYLIQTEGGWTQTSGPSRRRLNLEAIYSECSDYRNSEEARFSGSISTRWNPNSSTSWYVWLEPPNPRGMDWTDRDGAQHAADRSLYASILDLSDGGTRAVLEFQVDEYVAVGYASGGEELRKDVHKVVFVQVSARWNAAMELFELDSAEMLAAAETAMNLAGCELVTYAVVNVPSGGSGGGYTHVTLQAIHGIFTMNGGLVFPSEDA